MRLERYDRAGAALATCALHGLIVVAMALGKVGPSHARQAPSRERIELSFEAKPAPPPSEPPGENKTAPDTPEAKPRRKKASSRRPKRKRRPAAVAPAASETKPPPNPPRRMVGLSLGSTASGAGMAFEVGGGPGAKRGPGPKDEGPTAGPGGRNRRARGVPDGRHAWTKPQRIAPIVPDYPSQARAQGIEADVTLEVSLDRSGGIVAVRIVGPSAYPSLNQSARRAAQRERFSPALRDGVPVPYTLTFAYRFRLEG